MVDRTTPPEIHDFSPVSLSMPPAEVLANGLELSVVNYGEVEVCQIDVYIGGGVLDQHKPFASLFASQMITKGSDIYSAEEVAECMDFYGAAFAASVSDSCVHLSLKTANRNLEEVLKVMFSCITSPLFPQDELEIMKEKFLADAMVSREQVAYLASLRMAELLYGKDNMLAMDLTQEKADAISPDDLRQFHKRFFAPGNCKVILSGSIGEKELSLVRRTFASWQPAEFAKPSGWNVTPEPSMLEYVQKDGALQTAIEVTIDTVPRMHPDYIKLRILATVLGGYFGSRLMKNIREDKGYTYGIHAYHVGRMKEGHLAISTQCGTQYTQAVLDEIKKEMRILREELITDDELDVVRRHMLSDLVKTFDNAFSVASYIGLVKSGLIYPEYYNQQFEQITNVTPEELQRLAQRYLVEEKMRIVLAGDVAEKP